MAVVKRYFRKKEGHNMTMYSILCKRFNMKKIKEGKMVVGDNVAHIEL